MRGRIFALWFALAAAPRRAAVLAPDGLPRGFVSAFPWPANCAAVRANSTRALVLYNVDRVRIVSVIDALVDAGFEVGVLHQACAQTQSAHVLCNPSAPGITFVRAVASISTVDVLRAVIKFAPAIVIAGGEHTGLLRSTAERAVTDPSARLSSRVRLAVDALRCSLADERFWPALRRKSSLLELARSIGIPTPWVAQPPSPAGFAPEVVDALAARAPVVIKTDADGGGSGVTICHGALCVRETLARHRSRGVAATVQQFVRGPTLTYDAVALDGHTLGGVARAEVLTQGQGGISVLSRTVDCPLAADAVRRLFALVRFTGVGAADFIVDSRNGAVLMIDPNLRFGFGQTVDGTALGIGESLFSRLRRALSPALARAEWPEPARPTHSLAYMRFNEIWPDMFRWLGGELAYCADVYVPMQWAVRQLLERVSRGALEVTLSGGLGCSLREVRQPQLLVTQMCGRAGGPCDGRCRPLVTSTPLPTVADMLAPGGLCDPTSDWAREHFDCRERAERAAAAGRADALGAPARHAVGRAAWLEQGAPAEGAAAAPARGAYAPAEWRRRYGLSFCHNWTAPAVNMSAGVAG
ncbi:hypothetical protein KFE25_009820 [Diacronema lutheri]|uniref:ATP-grasp domain-containing protein n=1 Tax=Diacronema lutheri TaxID=2081491 RepID=A0A8J5WZX4_DIALT|nr:hypothetical protein KFE25_009820 [Diacronema lutheri]